MQIGSYRFSRMELAGSLGDLGTLLPLAIALAALGRVHPTTTFLLVGTFYLCSGLYYRIPIPIQPLKAVAAIAISTQVSPATIRAAGITIGALLLVLVCTNGIRVISRIFSKPIVRGIQLGIGLILMLKAFSFLGPSHLPWSESNATIHLGSMALSVNTVMGLVGIGVVYLLRDSIRWPAALVVIGLGVLSGIIMRRYGGEGQGPLHATASAGVGLPSLGDFHDAFFLLVIPQIPLTIGNAVFASSDTAHMLFGDAARRAHPRRLATTIGCANIAAGLLGGMPVCHGSGGVAAHYRFGARTGGSLIMLGALLLVLTVASGGLIMELLGLIPAWTLGILLFFTGLQMAGLLLDVVDGYERIVAVIIGITAVATKNMAIALGVGLVTNFVLQGIQGLACRPEVTEE